MQAALRRFALLCVAVAAVSAAGAQPAHRWTRAGGYAADQGLAGPAGSPVLRAAFAADGQTLIVQTAPGRLWQSADLGTTWQPYEPDPANPYSFESNGRSAPDVPAPAAGPDAPVVEHPYDAGVFFALGRDLYRSADRGETWINLTGDALGSVIGPFQTALAFSPRNPDWLVAANAAGLWKSLDGGLSWSSLNAALPNFPAARFLGTPAATRAVRVETESWGVVEQINGVSLWRPAPREAEASGGGSALAELAARAGLEAPPPAAPSGRLSALAAAGEESLYLYAGTAAGRIWVSPDGGASWKPSVEGLPPPAARVAALYGHPERAESAVAVLGAPEGPRVLRTTNGGVFWDDLTADLPPGRLTALAADGPSGALFVAGEAGVYYMKAELTEPGPPGEWQPAGRDLPAARVHDLSLDAVSGYLYAALEDFGVYRVRSPAVLDSLKVLNAADLTRRPAAPGGLLTVLGRTIRGARAEGRPAPLLAATEREAQIQVPFEARGESLQLSLETQGGRESVAFPFAEVSPAIFVDRGGPLVLDAGTGQLLDARHPARAGGQILILATGLGQVVPPWPTGVPAPLDDPPETAQPVRALLNGAPLRVVSATLAAGYVGAYMVQAELPHVLHSGVAELTLEAAGQRSNTVRIYTQP